MVPRDLPVRCWWCGDDPEYRNYHDAEWGYPVADDVRLFEKLCLEGFQAGLSWLTILRKRENFRRAFKGFEIDRVARYSKRDVERLLQDAGIVRHRGKIEAAINNAKRVRELQDAEGSLAGFIWRYQPDPKTRPQRVDRAAVGALTQTPASKALSKELKRRGFAFVGPTTLYAFMQAMGLVNDHLEECSFRSKIQRARRAFKVPS